MRTHAKMGLGAALLAGAAACVGRERAPASDSAAASAAARTAMRAGPDPSACPGDSFAAFLAAFESDTALQARYTRFPLERLTVADAAPEPREVVTRVSRAGVALPVMPAPAEQAAASLVARTEPAAGSGARVVLEKPDTDYQLVYVFDPVGTCWQLVRTEDRSL